MAGRYSAQEAEVGEASLPSPSTGLKTGRTPTLKLGRMGIPGKVGRGRSVAPLRKTRGCGPNVQGVEGGAWEDCEAGEGVGKNLSQFGEGLSNQIAPWDRGRDSQTDCALSTDGGFGIPDRLTRFRHCPSFRRSCNRPTRKAAGFARRRETCRGWLCSGADGRLAEEPSPPRGPAGSSQAFLIWW